MIRIIDHAKDIPKIPFGILERLQYHGGRAVLYGTLPAEHACRYSVKNAWGVRKDDKNLWMIHGAFIEDPYMIIDDEWHLVEKS